MLPMWVFNVAGVVGVMCWLAEPEEIRTRVII